jgi:putative Mn2+ efflux pump MntP
LRSPVSHDGQAPATPADQPTGWLLVSGAALSIDNLAVGFALGAFHVSLALAAIVIGVISQHVADRPGAGSRIGARTGQRGELIGGLVLIGVGVAVACGTV